MEVTGYNTGATGRESGVDNHPLVSCGGPGSPELA